MELSAEQFAQVAGNRVTGKQLKREKRGATRIPLGRRSAILRESGLMTVVIREISVTGASLVASRPMAVGERLILCLPRLEGADLRVKCSVLRCESGVGGRVFIIGLKFEEVLKTQWAAAATVPSVAGESADVTRIRQAMLGG